MTSNMVRPTRRDFLRSVSAAGAYLFLPSFAYPYGQKNARNISEYERTAELKARLDLIAVEEIEIPILPDELDRKVRFARNFLAEKIAEKKIPDPERPDKLWVPGEPNEKKCYRKTWFMFEPDSEYAGRIAKLSANALEHALNFFSHPRLTRPRYSFHVAQKKKDIESSPSFRDEVSIWIVYGQGYNDYVQVKFPYKNTEHVMQIPGDGKMLRGVESSLFFPVLEPSYTRTAVVYRPIIMATGQEPICLAITPVIEMLHHQTVEHIARHIEGGANIPNLAVPLSPQERFALSRKKHSDRNELFAHSYGRKWLLAYNKFAGLGLDQKEIDGMPYVPVSNEDIMKFCALIDKKGMKKTTDIYIDDPDALFTDFPAYR